MKNVKKLIAVLLTVLMLFTAVSLLSNCASEPEVPEETHTLIFEGNIENIDLGIDGFGITQMYGKIIQWLKTIVDNILNFIIENIHIENF